MFYGLDPACLADHKALAIIEHHRGKVTPLGFTAGSPGHVARENINFGGLQGWAAVSSAEGYNLNCICITEDSRGNSPAKINIKADVGAIFCQIPEANQICSSAADNLATLFDAI